MKMTVIAVLAALSLASVARAELDPESFHEAIRYSDPSAYDVDEIAEMDRLLAEESDAELISDREIPAKAPVLEAKGQLERNVERMKAGEAKIKVDPYRDALKTQVE